MTKQKRRGNKLEREEIEAEVETAREFEPRLQKLIVATTAPRDAAVQEAARQISAVQEKENGFRVTVFAWDDILDELQRHPDLIRHYYPAYALAPLNDPHTAWLAALLTADTIEIRTTPACRADALIEFLLPIAEDLARPRRGEGRTALVLTGADEPARVPRPGVYVLSEHGPDRLLHPIDQPADAVLSRWIAVLSFRRSTRSMREWLSAAPLSVRARLQDLFQEILPTTIGFFE